MIGSLSYFDELVTRTYFRIQASNILVENGRFTEAGLVENIAQTAAARAGYISTRSNQPVKVGYIGSLKNLEIYHLPKVNDELETGSNPGKSNIR
jgi:predicted hotdog family 3-hydroxylacyl-ACP dehydratase